MIDKEREDTMIHSDTDILQLISEFDRWRAEAGVSTNEGLWQMLAFLREAVESGEGLYARMLERQRSKAREMAIYARDYPYDASIAAEYMSEKLNGDPTQLDYDGAFFFCGDYIQSLSNFADNSPGPQLAAIYNTIFSNAIGSRLLDYWTVHKGKTPESAEASGINNPVIADILHLGFNIPMYVDSMQFGQGAWGEGAKIALAIDKHISSSLSRGQLCSLYPPDISVPIDWRRNAWARDKKFLDYLDQNFRGNESMPVWARDWMRKKPTQSIFYRCTNFFKQMRARK